MTGYGASSLDFELQFDVKSEVWQKVFDARSQVLIALLQRFNEEGIAIRLPDPDQLHRRAGRDADHALSGRGGRSVRAII